jgi:hypothetical protein
MMASSAADASHPLNVVIIGWNRPASMLRLVRSLGAAEYGDSPAPMSVTFALDFADNQTVEEELDRVMKSLWWPHGPVRLRRRTSRAGLAGNVLGAWVPAESDTRPALLLEDDIELSPLWWVWVQACLRRYDAAPAAVHDARTHAKLSLSPSLSSSPSLPSSSPPPPPPLRPPGLIGISLFTPDNMNEAFTNADRPAATPGGQRKPSCPWQSLHARARAPSRGGGDDDAETAGVRPASAVFFAQPVSWGGLYFAEPWRQFLAQAHALRRVPRKEQPVVPCPSRAPACVAAAAALGARGGAASAANAVVVVNRWGANSWKRLLALHMVAHGLYMVYPNLPRMASFSVNHVEAGVHVRESPALATQRRRHRRTLVSREWCAREGMRCGIEDAEAAFELPARSAVRLWDFYCQLQSLGDAGETALRSAGEATRRALPSPAGMDEVSAAAAANTSVEVVVLAAHAAAPRDGQEEVRRDELRRV